MPGHSTNKHPLAALTPPWGRLSPLLFGGLLSGCGALGLETIPPAGDPSSGDDSGQEDSGLPEISETDPPILSALVPYRNEDLVTVTGRALSGEAVTVQVVNTDRTDEYLSLADEDGYFSQDVVVDRGIDARVTALNENGPSQTQTTQACAIWDAYEIDHDQGDEYGDDCDTHPVLAESAFTDALSLRTLSGNVLEEGDEDWYQFVTIDETLIEDQFRYENYNFQVDFVAGGERYAFEVFRGGCGDESRQCSGEAYDEYSFSAEDVEPDESGTIPDDPRACGQAPYNDCADFSATYFIVVRRIDGLLNCDHYQLRVQNGTN